jgi:hypothetical protein
MAPARRFQFGLCGGRRGDGNGTSDLMSPKFEVKRLCAGRSQMVSRMDSDRTSAKQSASDFRKGLRDPARVRLAFALSPAHGAGITATWIEPRPAGRIA